MKRTRVLIVDDELGIRESLAGVLEDEGYSCHAVGSGEECLVTRTTYLRPGSPPSQNSCHTGAVQCSASLRPFEHAAVPGSDGESDNS